jgi:amino acid transporter
MMFTAAVVAGYAGPALPLVYLMSLVGVMLLVNTIAEFSRRLAHAGSFYAFNAAGLGPVFGFFAGWLLFAAYLYPQNLLAFWAFASAALASQLGIHIAWWVLTVAAAAAIWALSLRHQRLDQDLPVAGDLRDPGRAGGRRHDPRQGRRDR